MALILWRPLVIFALAAAFGHAYDRALTTSSLGTRLGGGQQALAGRGALWGQNTIHRSIEARLIMRGLRGGGDERSDSIGGGRSKRGQGMTGRGKFPEEEDLCEEDGRTPPPSSDQRRDDDKVKQMQADENDDVMGQTKRKRGRPPKDRNRNDPTKTAK